MPPYVSPDPIVALSLGLALVATSNAPVLLLDRDLRIVAASKSFCHSFNLESAKTEGCLLSEMGSGAWNKPQLLSMLAATAAGFAEIEGYEIDFDRRDRPSRRLSLNAHKLDYDGELRLILTISDITAARAAETLRLDLVKEKDVLLQELHHRVANSLQIIASVLMQNARKVQSDESRIHLVDAHQRVMSVAALQKQLAATGLGKVELRPYFAALCHSIGASMIRDPEQLTMEVKTDDTVTTADTSVSLGLIITELVINALKHAFPNNRHGRILVDYHSQGFSWVLSVGDDGVGMSNAPGGAKPGLGTGIIQALSKQLGAQVCITDAKPGTHVSIAHMFVPVLVGQPAVTAAIS